jgi:hypothetical protein
MNPRRLRAAVGANRVRKRIEVGRDSSRSSSHSAPADLDISRAGRKFFLRTGGRTDIIVSPYVTVLPRARDKRAPDIDVL